MRLQRPVFRHKSSWLAVAAALVLGTGISCAGNRAAKAVPAAAAPQQPQKAPAAREPSIEYSQYAKAARNAAQNWPLHAVRDPHGMVVTDDPIASKVGEEILKKGGNAIDAAVAVAYTLAVVYPEAGNIGGGGFMLIRRHDGKTAFIDYREVAPKKATAKMYLHPDGSRIPGASTIGYLSVGVPGSVAGMSLALQKFGTMKLAEVMAPAIRLAKDGFPVSARLAKDLQAGSKRLDRFPISRRIFLRDGKLYQAGEIFRQPELAATLERIAKNGPEEFYRGETAHVLAKQMASHGGIITLDDLAGYRAKIRTPLDATYHYGGHAWTVITSPPPSSGGVAIIETLNILQGLPLQPVPDRPVSAWNNARNVHYVAEAMRRAFADRAAWLADPDFTHVPVRGLTSMAYAEKLRATIAADKATPSSEVKAGDPNPYDRATAAAFSEWTATRGHTTHFSIVDAEGNAVSNTYTINDFFGSGVATASGFLLNDEMDDFNTDPGHPNVLFHLLQSQANDVAPDKRPLSSMVPTMVLRDGKLSFVTGSPGGPRIISATMLSALNWMRMGMSAQQAINAPRFHHQWMPDVLYVEPTMPLSTVRNLERLGYTIDARGWLGQVNAVGIDPRTGDRLGVADPRRHGNADGY
jgi:gamma-glutamyltranspeptidase/glutathione hydrolase